MTLTRAELAIMVDPRWLDAVVVRTARKQWTCTCANEVRPGRWVKTTRPGSWTQSYRATESEAESHADSQRRRYPDADVETGQDANRGYRPDCLGEIPAGSAYLEYLGDAAAYESGSRYCQRCGIAVWGKPARDADRLAEAATGIIDQAVAEGKLPG
jgi:hypothetical protein